MISNYSTNINILAKIVRNLEKMAKNLFLTPT